MELARSSMVEKTSRPGDICPMYGNVFLWTLHPLTYRQFLGSLTIAVGLLCLYFLGTPSEVPWLTKEEKRMANTRILENQSGHDRTGTKVWKRDQARECLVDPCVCIPNTHYSRAVLR